MLKVLLKEAGGVNWRSIVRRGDQKVVDDVLRAASDLGADGFDTKLLLGFLNIESGGKELYTFYNPSLEQYRGIIKRPYKVRGIRPIGSFQILQKFQNDYRKYGYDPGQFGDPYHQAKVVLRFIKDRRRSVGEDPARIYLSWNQGVGGANKIYQALRNSPDVEMSAIDRQVARNMRSNFAAKALKRYGLSSKDQLTPRIFVDRYNRLLGFSGADYAANQVAGKEGNVYLLGDSNTVGHSKYWKAYVAKNFGMNAKVINRAKNGHSLQKILNSLKDIKDVAGVIIGSAGGNNVAGMGKLSPEQIKNTLAPDGPYYQRNIAPLMSKLSELQRQGAKVAFFGLPFGRGKGKDCENNTPIARGTMDEVLTYAAKQYNVPYYSVYKQTEKVKGIACGVHYGGKKNQQAYRDALRSANPANAPAPKEELAYAKSISSGGKKIKISHNRFLRPYRYLQAAGIKFKELYEEFKRVYGGDWEKKLLPKHRADYIFGPEHFAALKKYAKDTIHLQSSKNLLALINKKNPSKKEPIIAKAEKTAEKKIEAVPASGAGGPAINDPKGVVADTIPVDDGDDLLSKIFGSFNESTGKGQKQKIRIILKS